MKLGNWDVLSPYDGATIWSSNNNELMIELDNKKLAKLKLLPEGVIATTAYNCVVRIDEKHKTINIEIIEH